MPIPSFHPFDTFTSPQACSKVPGGVGRGDGLGGQYRRAC
jgi:hypothetical protein